MSFRDEHTAVSVLLPGSRRFSRAALELIVSGPAAFPPAQIVDRQLGTIAQLKLGKH